MGSLNAHEASGDRVVNEARIKPTGVLVSGEDLGGLECLDVVEPVAVVRRPLAGSVRAFHDPFEAAAEWGSPRIPHEQRAHLSGRAAVLEEVAAEEVVEA
jgi:hypothetical protein